MTDSSTPAVISPHLCYPDGGVGHRRGDIENKRGDRAEETQGWDEESVAMLNSCFEDGLGDVGCMGDEECGCGGIEDRKKDSSQEEDKEEESQEGEEEEGPGRDSEKGQCVCERRSRKLCAMQSGYSWTQLGRHHHHQQHQHQHHRKIQYGKKKRAEQGRDGSLVMGSPATAASSLAGWFSWLDNTTTHFNLNFKFKFNITSLGKSSLPWSSPAISLPFIRSSYTPLQASPASESFNLNFKSQSKSKQKSKLSSVYPYISAPYAYKPTYPRPLTSPRRILSTLLLALLATPMVLLGCVLLYGGVPPGYGDVRRAERAIMEKHGVGRGEGEGKGYLRFKDHIWGHGFNNVLQEVLFTSYLAYTLNRTYVFEDYTWSRLPLPYTIYDFTLRPTRIPMGAFLSGALAGEDVPIYSGHIKANSTDSNSTTRAKIAVSAEYFEHVCKPEETFVLENDFPSSSTTSISSSPSSLSPFGSGSGSAMSSRTADEGDQYDLRGPREGLDGVDIFKWWAWRMRQEDVRDRKCVEVREGKRRVFDAFFFGSTRLLPLYPGLRESPVLKGFMWSDIIRSAADRIARRVMEEIRIATSTSASSFSSSSKRHPNLPSSPTPSPASPPPSSSDLPSPSSPINSTLPPISSTPTPIPGLVALHLRRGDYKRHCARLAGWESRYMGFNRFEGLVDRFEPWGEDEDEREGDYEGGGNGETDGDEDLRARKMAHYMKHCLPSIPQIVKRLRQVRADHASSFSSHTKPYTNNTTTHTLNQVYILTNAWPSYISSLRLALQQEGWGNVWSTADFEGGLDRRERGVGVGVDMALAVEKVEVFVGNGFSSMSANIVMLRLASGFDVSTNRFL